MWLFSVLISVCEVTNLSTVQFLVDSSGQQKVRAKLPVWYFSPTLATFFFCAPASTSSHSVLNSKMHIFPHFNILEICTHFTIKVKRKLQPLDRKVRRDVMAATYACANLATHGRYYSGNHHINYLHW